MNNKKIIIGILLFVCVVFSYYLGKWNGASICRNVSNIQFVEVEEIDDTTYYTGKDVSHYMYSPTRFNEGVIPDASTAAKIAFQYVSAVYKDCAVNEQPYQIKLVNKQIWIVEGSHPINVLGGTFYICIEKYTGKIWAMYHDK